MCLAFPKINFGAAQRLAAGTQPGDKVEPIHEPRVLNLPKTTGFKIICSGGIDVHPLWICCA